MAEKRRENASSFREKMLCTDLDKNTPEKEREGEGEDRIGT